MTTQPITATAPQGVPRSSFVDTFESQPGTPGSRTGHVFPSINRIRKNLNDTTGGPLKKLMVANRGEISIRIVRSAHELAMTTVAIYSFEDRYSAHRYKADEAYQVGAGLSPVQAYLAIEDIIRIALEHGVDMIHPGYGFLSENPAFAKAVEDAGIAFIGPRPETIDGLGDKTKARDLARKAGVPIVPGTPGPIEDYREAAEFVKEVGFPVIIKAAMGGGGRGMRVVRKQEEFEEAFSRAKSEAKSAFGDPTVFIERFLDRPRHIEVQLLADGEGNVVHLFERDCSVQRRHQKVVEVAPASNLVDETRQAILSDAVKLARTANYRNAGTAEFLVDQQNRHYFIEINPRLQVEHTITEEITGIDIVGAQIQIAAGATLADLGLTQATIQKRGSAIQCRITTEDPSVGFAPDTGRIEVYRSAGGNGVRLDASSGFAGAQITPHYDSLLVKVTCRGATYEVTRRKMLRALVEFRIRGVKTNIPFLFRLLTHDAFAEARTWTTMIDDTPELFNLVQSKNRAQKLLAYLGDMAVNGSPLLGQVGEPGLKTEIEKPPFTDPKDASKPLDASKPCLEGWRNIIVNEGPEAFAKAVRSYNGTLIMDTTWRDAHQSLFATRLRTIDMVNIAKETSHVLKNAFSLECWGGATFDVAMRFLYEDPWERLRKLRKLVPNIPFQALIRGANAVGYTSYPDNLIYEFSKKAVENGLDIFRVFDSLNNLDSLRLGIDAAKKAGGVAEGTICYTGDVANPKKHPKYTLEYYLNLTDELVKVGIHILGIKDMAGLLKPAAARMLVGAIRKKYPDLPIHVHSHDTAGIALASMIACAEAGADVVDVAIDSMSGLTSQPSMGALVSALEQTGLGPGIRHEDIQNLNLYWTQVRQLYSCFEANVKASDSSVFDHEMPGGQYTNLMFQSQQLGLGSQWNAIKDAYIQANKLLGDIVKVTPSSKVCGDLAQFLVANKLTPQEFIEKVDKLDLPSSVYEYFEGRLGVPPGGFPEFRTKLLRGRPVIEGRPGAGLKPVDLSAIKKELTKKYGKTMSTCDAISHALYPKVFEEYQDFLENYGDLSTVPTRFFCGKPDVNEEIQVFIESGKMLIVKLLAVGAVSDKGTRDVFMELNGESRVLTIDDKSAAVEHETREKADSKNPGSIGSPISGVIIEIRVKEGQQVKQGDPLAILSAMKMETNISAPVSGKVSRIAVKQNDSVAGGDLVLLIEH
ncbi:pyruvate carboxylase [Ceraceosorus bombacis]|uniref:Pyruvate carboxylase n=2 Tax=Ceraceosorus TaxID=401624 RepID=A0A0P1BNT6_9BASI|nr:putative pyruvate carboxylase [Ceraceosorus guamensis]PWN40561.1 putative pyruvate carboxylase [Ceraceosorus guamensis]CEH18494.1 pyruvate carboxylase [Ceraceosorus bombacis]